MDFVSFDRHLHLVAHVSQEKASFRAVDRHLTDELVEALTIEFFPNRTNPCFACLTMHNGEA